MIISSIYQGLLYGILGLGIYMTFRILDFPDLTAEGSFPLGGAVAVTLMNFGFGTQSCDLWLLFLTGAVVLDL